MKILLSETQVNNIMEVNYISKDKIMNLEPEDKLEFNTLGVYTMNDMDKFYNITPFNPKQIRGDSTSEWKQLTQHYPVVIIDIPIHSSKQFFKGKSKTETYSLADNNLYIIFVNNGKHWGVNNWKVMKFWLRKSNDGIFNQLKKNIINNSPTDLIDNLIQFSLFKSHDARSAHHVLYNILYNIPKTDPNDNIITDTDIDTEFREPIRFTVHNGQNPQPIVDKIIQKYGRLSKDINMLINLTNPHISKRPKPNPYLT